MTTFTTTFRNTAFILVLALIPMMGADGGCGQPPILDNNGFDLWCGNELCYWEVESGAVLKVPTWHESDFGASFRGPIASISQVSDIGSETNCLEFTAVANIALGTTVTVEVDYFDDGTVEVEQNIPSSEWARIKFELPTPTTFQQARFRIRSQGNGEAILAEMRVERSNKCSAPPVEITNREIGQTCNSDNECTSGDCSPEVSQLVTQNVCSGCDASTDCQAGEACTIFDSGNGDPLALDCGPEGQRSLGEFCVTNEECGTGICCQGLCSTCCGAGDASCPGECEPTAAGPSMCGGDSEMGIAGDPCIDDSQCEGSCLGSPLKACSLDRRRCTTDENCPASAECVEVGVADGICG